MGAESAYNQYASPSGQGGNMVVRLGRWAWGGPDKPGRVLIRVGTLVKGADKQPHIGEVTATRRWTIHSLSRATFVIPGAAAAVPRRGDRAADVLALGLRRRVRPARARRAGRIRLHPSRLALTR